MSSLLPICLTTLFVLRFLSCAAVGDSQTSVDDKGSGKDGGARMSYMDLSGDGKVNAVRLTWNGKDVLLIDEDGRFLWRWARDGIDAAQALTKAFVPGAEPPVTWSPLRAGWGTYMLLADVDGDGQFAGRADFYYRAVDVNHDGMPEFEYFNASTIVELDVNVNGERHFKYLDFLNFSYPDEQRYGKGGRYYQNVHGSGFFHNTRVNWRDISLAWETPIAWYDFNNDGFAEMVMRITDEGYPSHELDQGQSGGAQEAEFAFELNGELNRDKWHSLDFQLTYTAYKNPGLPLKPYTDDIKSILPPDYARKYFGKGWEQFASVSKRVMMPYIDGYKIATDFTGWTSIFLLWDEDNDDNRWEQMFGRQEVSNGGFADKLGDRIEIDSKFRGKGQLYIGAFDGKIHLFGADKTEWPIDYYGHYKGSTDRIQTNEGPKPPVGVLHDIAHYYDTDKNGFIDRIEYGTAEYGREKETWKLTRVVNLFDFADKENPHPDVQPLFDLKVDSRMTGWKLSTWDGTPIRDWTDTAPYDAYRKIKAVYERVCASQWQEARMLYDTAVYLGLNKSENLDECAVPPKLTKEQKLSVKDVQVLRGYASLTDAVGLREKYNDGYWLKEKVLTDIMDGIEPEMTGRIQKLYYTGRISELCSTLIRRQQNGAPH